MLCKKKKVMHFQKWVPHFTVAKIRMLATTSQNILAKLGEKNKTLTYILVLVDRYLADLVMFSTSENHTAFPRF